MHALRLRRKEMGLFTKASYVATFLVCLFVNVEECTPTRGRKTLPQFSILDDLCSGLESGAPVRVLAWPVDDVREEGTTVDVCQATDLLFDFLTGGAPGSSKPDCSDKDIKRALVLNSFPKARSICDVTDAFPTRDPSAQKRLICWPPPWRCSTHGRRLMQSTEESNNVKVSVKCEVSTESSSGDGGFATSKECSQSSVSIKINGETQETGGIDEDPDEPQDLELIEPQSGSAALSVCKGSCCVTTVFSGGMYTRILDMAEKKLCKGFRRPHPKLVRAKSVAVARSSKSRPG